MTKDKINEDFIFVDGWTMYCNNGNSTRITKKDLKEAKAKGMDENDIKLAAFDYLTHPKLIDRIIKESIENSYEF
jgi:hypothetical protein